MLCRGLPNIINTKLRYHSKDGVRPYWTITDQSTITLGQYVATGSATAAAVDDAMRDQSTAPDARSNLADLIVAGLYRADFDSSTMWNRGVHTGAIDGGFDFAPCFLQ